MRVYLPNELIGVQIDLYLFSAYFLKLLYVNLNEQRERRLVRRLQHGRATPWTACTATPAATSPTRTRRTVRTTGTVLNSRLAQFQE